MCLLPFSTFKCVCNISNWELVIINIFSVDDKPTDLILWASAMIFLISSPPKMFDFTKNELLSTSWDIGNLFNSSISQRVHLSFLHNAIKIVIVSSTSLRSSIYPGRVRNIATCTKNITLLTNNFILLFWLSLRNAWTSSTAKPTYTSVKMLLKFLGMWGGECQKSSKQVNEGRNDRMKQ